MARAASGSDTGRKATVSPSAKSVRRTNGHAPSTTLAVAIQKNPGLIAQMAQAVVQLHHQSADDLGDAIGLKEARDRLGDLVARVQHGGHQIAITRNGKPAAMLISMEDWAIFVNLMNRVDNEIADQIKADQDESFERYVPKRARQV